MITGPLTKYPFITLFLNTCNDFLGKGPICIWQERNYGVTCCAAELFVRIFCSCIEFN